MLAYQLRLIPRQTSGMAITTQAPQIKLNDRDKDIVTATQNPIKGTLPYNQRHSSRYASVPQK